MERPGTLTDLPPGSPPTGRRGEVLALLREARGSLAAQDVARRTGLHLNTARFHLDGLVAAGLVERTTEPREQPGRPRVLYAAREEAHSQVRSFQLLAEMLTGLVASAVPEPSATAVQAGREWGRHLTERVPPSQQLSPAEATARLGRVLESVGFDPQVVDRDDRTEVHIRHCPFREVAERHQGVVCALHLGLIRGALEEMRAPVSAADLQPFVEPSLCISHLRPARARRKGRGRA